MSMIDFFNIIFENHLQEWCYIFVISYIAGKVGIHCWRKWFMHKKDKKDDK